MFGDLYNWFSAPRHYKAGIKGSTQWVNLISISLNINWCMCHSCAAERLGWTLKQNQKRQHLIFTYTQIGTGEGARVGLWGYHSGLKGNHSGLRAKGFHWREKISVTSGWGVTPYGEHELTGDCQLTLRVRKGTFQREAAGSKLTSRWVLLLEGEQSGGKLQVSDPSRFTLQTSLLILTVWTDGMRLFR